MAITAGSLEKYVEEYPEIQSTLPGQGLAWLEQLRQQSWGQFSTHGFPTIQEEDWRYTNVTPLIKKSFQSAVAKTVATSAPEALASYLIPDCWQVVIVDGHFSKTLSQLEGLPEDITVMALSDALTECPEKVASYLGKAVEKEGHGFIHYNTAWFSEGLFVSIAQNVKMKQPLQLIHIVSQENVATATRNIIIAEAGAEGVVIESYFGNQDQAYLTSSISEVFVAENAHLTLYKLQNEASKALHFSGIYSQQDRQSTFNYLDFSFGALIARNELHTSLGFASSCDLNGLFVAGGRQHIDNHTWIKHQQAHGSSRELFKGILDGRARGVFQGCVEVFEGAQKIDSEMHNHNLLLSDNAEIDTKPQLIIYADDVKCAHGVTVGQLEDASIFYLQSRSVSEEDARDMLTFAFANEMVDKIKVSSFKKYILALLLQKFPQGSIEQEWL